MHTYFLKNIVKNMRINWKIYLIIFLELCVCFTLMYLGIDEMISHGLREELLLQEKNNHIHTVQYQMKKEITEMSFGPYVPILNLKELELLESNQAIQTFYYAEVAQLSYRSPTMSTDSDGVKIFDGVDVVIANRHFLEQYLGISDASPESCYIIPELLSLLQREFISAPFNNVAFNGDSIALNGKEFDFHQIQGKPKTIVGGNYTEFDIEPEQAIFILKDETNEVLKDDIEVHSVKIKYQTVDNVLDFEIQERFFEELNGYADGEYIFSENYLLQMFRKGGDELNSEVRNFGWAGSVAFIIVVVGISGIFILIIQKRYKQLCICHINGLTKRGAFMQIFIEVFLLVSIPSIIGMILVVNFQGNFNSIYYPIEWHPVTTVVFIFLPIVITLFVTLISSSWLRNLDVVKWLKRIE